jgi:hypothetical protein
MRNFEKPQHPDKNKAEDWENEDREFLGGRKHKQKKKKGEHDSSERGKPRKKVEEPDFEEESETLEVDIDEASSEIAFDEHEIKDQAQALELIEAQLEIKQQEHQETTPVELSPDEKNEQHKELIKLQYENEEEDETDTDTTVKKEFSENSPEKSEWRQRKAEFKQAEKEYYDALSENTGVGAKYFGLGRNKMSDPTKAAYEKFMSANKAFYAAAQEAGIFDRAARYASHASLSELNEKEVSESETQEDKIRRTEKLEDDGKVHARTLVAQRHIFKPAEERLERQTSSVAMPEGIKNLKEKALRGIKNHKVAAGLVGSAAVGAGIFFAAPAMAVAGASAVGGFATKYLSNKILTRGFLSKQEDGLERSSDSVINMVGREGFDLEKYESEIFDTKNSLQRRKTGIKNVSRAIGIAGAMAAGGATADSVYDTTDVLAQKPDLSLGEFMGGKNSVDVPPAESYKDRSFSQVFEDVTSIESPVTPDAADNKAPDYSETKPAREMTPMPTFEDPAVDMVSKPVIAETPVGNIDEASSVEMSQEYKRSPGMEAVYKQMAERAEVVRARLDFYSELQDRYGTTSLTIEQGKIVKLDGVSVEPIAVDFPEDFFSRRYSPGTEVSDVKDIDISTMPQPAAVDATLEPAVIDTPTGNIGEGLGDANVVAQSESFEDSLDIVPDATESLKESLHSAFENVEAMHTVERGENLSSILFSHLNELVDSGLSLPEGVGEDEVAHYMYQSFPEFTDAADISARLTPEQWMELGVSSGDPNLIYPGETIDMHALAEKMWGSNAEAALDPSLAATNTPVGNIGEGLGDANVVPQAESFEDSLGEGSASETDGQPVAAKPDVATDGLEPVVGNDIAEVAVSADAEKLGELEDVDTISQVEGEYNPEDFSNLLETIGSTHDFSNDRNPSMWNHLLDVIEKVSIENQEKYLKGLIVDGSEPDYPHWLEYNMPEASGRWAPSEGIDLVPDRLTPDQWKFVGVPSGDPMDLDGAVLDHGRLIEMLFNPEFEMVNVTESLLSLTGLDKIQLLELSLDVSEIPPEGFSHSDVLPSDVPQVNRIRSFIPLNYTMEEFPSGEVWTEIGGSNNVIHIEAEINNGEWKVTATGENSSYV